MAALERNCNGFIWLSVSLLGGEREGEGEQKGGKRRRVSFSCQSSQMREDVQNKLFHLDELKIILVHLKTFADCQ